MAKTTTSRTVVPARVILEKIQNREAIEFYENDNVIIDGDLDLNELDLPKQHIERTEAQKKLGILEEAKRLDSPITIINAEIKGKINFNGIIFQKPVNFGKSQFHENAEFRGTLFSENADFSGAIFKGYADFISATFCGDVLFCDANFSKEGAYFNM